MAAPKRKRAAVSKATKAVKATKATKATKTAKTAKVTSAQTPSTDADPNYAGKPFRFLDLPAELRNNVYEKVLQDESDIRLLRKSKTNRGLTSLCAISRINKQVRGEFIGLATVAAPLIRTIVKDFNFSHVVTFLNRLSDAELQNLLSDKAEALNRRIQIDLTFTKEIKEYEEDYVQEYQVEFEAQKMLIRWLTRLGHPTKHGAGIDFEYECISFRYLNQAETMASDACLFFQRGTRGHGQCEAICDEIDQYTLIQEEDSESEDDDEDDEEEFVEKRTRAKRQRCA